MAVADCLFGLYWLERWEELLIGARYTSSFFPSLINLTVSVDVKHCETKKDANDRAQELCESRGGRPGLPVLHNTYGLRGRKGTLNSL